ncbi:MAG: hypothetical protein HY979_03630 [Candidatus Magasanikbacteria bacterium]|nr:hypothetical protein [Candidatus Magasanikbacteria bacterium]
MVFISNAKKSLLACVIFVFSGFFSCFYLVQDWKLAMPNLIFYIILVINTYFSINTFSAIIPKDNWSQKVIDILLMLVYIYFSLNIGKPFWFGLGGIILFFMAVLKYLNLGTMVGFSKLLKRKIFVDTLGFFAFLLTFSGVLMGYGLVSMWVLTIVFAVVNFYLFFINPLYIRPVR